MSSGESPSRSLRPRFLERAGKEGFSIPAQQKLLRQYALDHGISIACEFTDVETAKRSGRAGFGEMLTYLRRNSACRIILVEKTDRLYRNLKDWVTIDELGIEIHFVKQGTVIPPDSRSSDKFMHGIQVLMAKNYIDNLSEETRKGMLEKAEQGLIFRPLGLLEPGAYYRPRSSRRPHYPQDLRVVRDWRVLPGRSDQNGQSGRHGLPQVRRPGAEGDHPQDPAQPHLHGRLRLRR
jgi:DNA invertase Pin-like site-specific DNA recombinase